MLVPVKLFLNDQLIDKLRDDNSLVQATNVSTLPGIQKASIVMPDCHQGYGFSIGGVAAFDMEEGIISPGGVGFDINCLPGTARILTEQGYHKSIKDFEQDFIEVKTSNEEYSLKSLKTIQSLTSFDVENKVLLNKPPTFFMKKNYSGELFKIKTQFGYEISVTKDHPLLTKKGMVKAEELRKNVSLAIMPFKGVGYEEVEEELLVNKEFFTKQESLELEKRGLLPLKTTNSKLPLLTKLFGYLLGDGSVYLSGKKGYVNAFGPENDLKTIQKDLEKIGFSAKIYSRTRDHKIPTKYGEVNFSSTNYELHAPSKSLAKLFFALGYPQGNKTITPFLIPSWLMKSPLWIKRLFLSGFFGAELSAPRTHTKTGFVCPTISINKNTVQLDNVREYAIQLMLLLEEFGVNTHKLLIRKDYKNQYGLTHRLKIQISSEETNLLKLWEQIGFSYNEKRTRLSEIAILYIKEKKRITALRLKTARRVKELKKKGLTLKEVQKLLESKITNKRFLERHYYEQAGQRIPLNFYSFKDYVVIKEEELRMNGCFYDEIESISKEFFEGLVYDFNISETHSFVADNVVVSNCGVRVLKTPFTKDQVIEKMSSLLDELFVQCPVGVGKEAKIRISDEEYEAVLNDGVKWAVTSGYGTEDDLLHCEANGRIEHADSTKVSPRARKRGRRQLGTVGAGNHFIEIQEVTEVFDEKIADVYGLKKDQIVVMIHCGSRGLGHQVCTDYIRRLEDEQPEIVDTLKDKNLIYAPLSSQLAKDYFGAMSAAANYAFVNRHILGHFVRKSFSKVFGREFEKDIITLYDVAHNIAKKELHVVDGVEKEVMVHRKGATRAFPPGHPELSEEFKPVGQPVLIPGSMGTSSYILAGTQKAMEVSFGSSAHGAGRVMSRFAATKNLDADKIQKSMDDRGITLKAASKRGIVEEAADAYKDVDEVIKVTCEAGIAKKVAQLKPLGVIKG